ncbi:MAG TPA: OsmC family protein [Caulobacteraceae bacterium]|nr:OsmC family protein [Caulobacteraceae bacterium]
MSTYRATVEWTADGGDFLKHRYSREHVVAFDGGLTVPGSASPHIVRAPYSRADALDPEAAFTAALSQCHMLWFLDIAARAGFAVASYRDEAEGTLADRGDGKLVMTRVVLRPTVTFAGERQPTADELAHLHHRAHQECFLANSVKTEVVVEPDLSKLGN